MKRLDCQQGSVEWLEARAGVVTASEADALVTPTWKVSKAQTVDAYVARKLAERWSGPLPSFAGSFAMGQGNILEEEARPWYAFQYGVKVETVGLLLTDDGAAGCSPDGLISLSSGSIGLEIKCPESPAHVRYLLEGVVPADYRCQVQFSLWVSKFPAWKFVSYRRHYPALVLVVEPDEKAFSAFTEAMAGFKEKFDAGWKRLIELNDGREPFKGETMVFSTDRQPQPDNGEGITP